MNKALMIIGLVCVFLGVICMLGAYEAANWSAFRGWLSTTCISGAYFLARREIDERR